MIANLCFALRAKSRIVHRSYAEGKKLDDNNLLMRMQQIGALSMAIAVLIYELSEIWSGVWMPALRSAAIIGL
eukprot:scaffold22740_cov139-Cylindrotheca_fusiformis.AAC.10